MGLHVGWRHLRIGPGFTLRGFARRGVALLCESARQGFLTNATIECAILACARAVITLWLRSCCCCCCCRLISVAQHDDGASPSSFAAEAWAEGETNESPQTTFVAFLPLARFRQPRAHTNAAARSHGRKRPSLSKTTTAARHVDGGQGEED